MASLFSSPNIPAPAPVQAAPQVTDPSVQAAAQAQQTAAANADCRASTILTSGQGDTSAAAAAKKTLLGN